MHDVELYEAMLGIEKPWRVKEVRMSVATKEIEVEVECTVRDWGCGECHGRMAVKDYAERRWRHMDSCQFTMWIVASVPRLECAAHGSRTARVPWAEEKSRFTKLFERWAIDVMKQTSQNGACKLLGITWDEAEGIKERAVRRGLAGKDRTPPTHVCFDEKAIGKGHRYATVAVRVDNGTPTVDYIAQTREQKAADGYWRQWTREELASVQSVSMDMWHPYAQSVIDNVPGGTTVITYDPFHIATRMNAALDQVRRGEHMLLLAKGCKQLSGSRRMWLYGFENLPDKYRPAFKDLLKANLRTGKAWSLKETFRDFFRCSSIGEARGFFKDWYRAVMRSRLDPVVKFAKSCKEHLDNILTYFVHRVSNAYAENMNSFITVLVTKARGYRSFERLERDLFFHYGGLNLYPSTP